MSVRREFRSFAAGIGGWRRWGGRCRRRSAFDIAVLLFGLCVLGVPATALAQPVVFDAVMTPEPTGCGIADAGDSILWFGAGKDVADGVSRTIRPDAPTFLPGRADESAGLERYDFVIVQSRTQLQHYHAEVTATFRGTGRLSVCRPSTLQSLPWGCQDFGASSESRAAITFELRDHPVAIVVSTESKLPDWEYSLRVALECHDRPCAEQVERAVGCSGCETMAYESDAATARAQQVLSACVSSHYSQFNGLFFVDVGPDGRAVRVVTDDGTSIGPEDASDHWPWSCFFLRFQASPHCGSAQTIQARVDVDASDVEIPYIDDGMDDEGLVMHRVVELPPFEVLGETWNHMRDEVLGRRFSPMAVPDLAGRNLVRVAIGLGLLFFLLAMSIIQRARSTR